MPRHGGGGADAGMTAASRASCRAHREGAPETMDLVVRNARLASAPEAPPVDIGVAAGRIVAVQRGLGVQAPSYDAGGHLTCAGLVETHIHLEKSRIADRCAPETGRLPMAMERVSAVKHTFTVEDAYRRAAATLEGCIKFGATRMRAD